MEAHVGPLARAVDREVAQRHGRHSVVHMIEIAQLFSGQLADPVRRNGLRQRVFPHRDRDIIAVHRRARGVHEPLDGAPYASFEQHLGGFDVIDRVDIEIFPPALSHAGLRREMKNVSPAGKERREVGSLNRRFDEPEFPMTCQRRQVPLLHRARIVVRETVDADDVSPGSY